MPFQGMANSRHDLNVHIGICDYNYFTKVFKGETEMVPRLYRKETTMG